MNSDKIGSISSTGSFSAASSSATRSSVIVGGTKVLK